jgi:hypothetical protein
VGGIPVRSFDLKTLQFVEFPEFLCIISSNPSKRLTKSKNRMLKGDFFVEGEDS